jgi:hypothetical protein
MSLLIAAAARDGHRAGGEPPPGRACEARRPPVWPARFTAVPAGRPCVGSRHGDRVGQGISMQQPMFGQSMILGSVGVATGPGSYQFAGDDQDPWIILHLPTAAPSFCRFGQPTRSLGPRTSKGRVGQTIDGLETASQRCEICSFFFARFMEAARGPD